jgi:hypothetical protein
VTFTNPAAPTPGLARDAADPGEAAPDGIMARISPPWTGESDIQPGEVVSFGLPSRRSYVTVECGAALTWVPLGMNTR